LRLAATAARVSLTRVGTLRVVLDIVISIASCIASGSVHLNPTRVDVPSCWVLATWDYGAEGSLRSVADITDEGSLAESGSTRRR
jgi:hypothetical protein